MNAGRTHWEGAPDAGDEAGRTGDADTHRQPALTQPRWWPADVEIDEMGEVHEPSPARPAYAPTVAPPPGPPAWAEGPPPIPLAPGMSETETGRLPRVGAGTGAAESGAEFDSTIIPGWDTVPGDPGAYDWEFKRPEPQSRVRLVAAGLLLVTGITVAAVLLTGGDDGTGAAESPSTTAPPATASVLAPDQVAVYQPQQVTRRVVDGRVEVSWQAPTRTDGVAGYMAIAQSPAGAYQKTELPEAGEMRVVFGGAPVTADSCVVVVTLVTGSPAMRLAPGAPACGPVSTKTPAAGASGSGSPSPSTPRP